MSAAPGPPLACQYGHPLVWLLRPGMRHAEGEGLAACACARRRLDGREHKGSQPVLWRWVPPVPVGVGYRNGTNQASLRPQFVSQNRVAFALALRLLDLLDEAGALSTEVREVSRRAEQVALLAQRVREVAPEMVGPPAPRRAGGPNPGPEGS